MPFSSPANPPSYPTPLLNRTTIDGPSPAEENILLVLLPLLIVLSTLLFFILVFLIFVLVLRKRKGVRLGDDYGPVDLSRGDGVSGEGGLEGVEARWLEHQEEDVQRGYRRAKDWQLHYPPSSIPTDITLPQFLSIQEKGVSAWSFEPDYESNPSLFVQSRTEITFFADGPGMSPEEGGGNSVMANLPLPKLNEVYYWECKIFEKDPGTKVSIGLATKPYPSFRMPGLNRNSVAYFSDGFKSHNYPFTSTSYGPPLAEGDVLGIGYRPRSGVVFFTRNGRKHEDAFTGLQRFNLFPCVGASGPASVHVNLGQSGFVFIEANVKKWGLAPSVGTLAPPPAYGSERGSILLEAGLGSGARDQQGEGSSPRRYSTHHRSRRLNPPSPSSAASTTPVRSSPLRPPHSTERPWTASVPFSIPTTDEDGPSPYVSPVDRESTLLLPPLDPYPTNHDRRSTEDEDESDVFHSPRSSSHPGSDDEDSNSNSDADDRAAGLRTPTHPETEPSSPILMHNPPTPNLLDISLHTLRDREGIHGFFERGGVPSVGPSSSSHHHRHRRADSASSSSITTHTTSPSSRRQSRGPPQGPPTRSPPSYSPLDPVVYANGVPTDLPASVISAAFEAAERTEGGHGNRNGNGADGQGERSGWRAWFNAFNTD